MLSEVEHSSVLNAAAWLEADGAELTMVGVDATGRADPQRFAAALRPGGERRDGTVLACLQAANPEVGTVQPVEQVAAACAAPACRCWWTRPPSPGASRSRPAGRC